MAERRSLVGRAVRWVGRAAWTLVSTSGDLDTGPVRSDRARRPRRPSRSVRHDIDDPRHHRLF